MTLSVVVSIRDLRREPTPHYCIPIERRRVNFFIIQLEDATSFRNRFGERAPGILRKIAQVVTREMPAHVQFTIQFADGGEMIPVQRVERTSKDLSLDKDDVQQTVQDDVKKQVRTTKISRKNDVEETDSKKVVTRTISRSMSRDVTRSQSETSTSPKTSAKKSTSSKKTTKKATTKKTTTKSTSTRKSTSKKKMNK